jgi:D-alanine-D-alanine ligase
MRICLLTTQDLDADPFPDDDWPCDPRPFLPEATWDVVTLRKETCVETVRTLVSDGYDLFFNLCDGAADEDKPGIEVVRTLEEADVPFTGASSDFYEPTREEMKRACAAAGIATPAWVLARTGEDVERAAATLRFPLFVKHHNSYASVALSRASRVRTPAGLRRQARKIMRRYDAALIEEFVDGIECTVLVAENPDDPDRPTTYTPIQYRFPDGETFKHEHLKWVAYDGLTSFPVEDAALAARLRDAAARFFVALGGVNFGRCDLRVDACGTPFMLEINPNCGVYYPQTDPGSADLCLLHDPDGHEGFTRRIVAAALRRHARRNGVSPGPSLSS